MRVLRALAWGIACAAASACALGGTTTAEGDDGGGDAGDAGHARTNDASGEASGCLPSACAAPGQCCGDQCVDLSTDVANCGSCGVACSPPNATGACAGAMCTIGKCEAGYGDCNLIAADGCEAPLAVDAANCGSCGNRCPVPPNASATCANSTCGGACKPGYVSLAGECANFGGAYENSDPTCPSCENADPYSNACGCPAGTSAAPALRVLNDCAGIHGGLLSFCETSASSPETDWAGAYEQDDGVPCGLGCRAANPYTGGCSCPAGATVIALRTLVDCGGGGIIGSQVFVCTYTSAPVATFGGAYEVDDAVQGGLGCRVNNPWTGGCSCPGGTTAHPVRVIVDVGGGAMIGSQIFICSHP